MDFFRKSKYNRRGILGMIICGGCSYGGCIIFKILVEGLVDGVMINNVMIYNCVDYVDGR